MHPLPSPRSPILHEALFHDPPLQPPDKIKRKGSACRQERVRGVVKESERENGGRERRRNQDVVKGVIMIRAEANERKED